MRLLHPAADPADLGVCAAARLYQFRIQILTATPDPLLIETQVTRAYDRLRAIHIDIYPRFVPVGPADGRPVQFDDTCYFLSFADEKEARLVADILNSPHCLEFMESLMFRDSKRPVTVELLQRLNLGAIAQDAGLAAQWQPIQRVAYGSLKQTPQLELVMERPERSRR